MRSFKNKHIVKVIVCITWTVVALILICCDKSGTMRVVAGDGKAGFVDGKHARFNKPIRLTPFHDKSVIVADINNHAIRIVNFNGDVTTIAGGPEKKGYEDGPAGMAKFSSPHGVAFNPKTGIIAVAEAGNHTIRLITPVSEDREAKNVKYTVSTLAGIPGKEGFNDGPVDAALFNSPHSIIWMNDSILIVADIGNARIRMIKDGMVQTVAGADTVGDKDGYPLESSFKYPMDIVLTDSQTVLIADAGTHLVRKLVLFREVSSLPLIGKLQTPHGISAGNNDYIYIADMGSHRILSIDQKGNISTVCGTGAAGREKESLNKPAAVLHHEGFLWIADLENHQIKVIQPSP